MAMATAMFLSRRQPLEHSENGGSSQIVPFWVTIAPSPTPAFPERHLAPTEMDRPNNAIQMSTLLSDKHGGQALFSKDLKKKTEGKKEIVDLRPLNGGFKIFNQGEAQNDGRYVSNVASRCRTPRMDGQEGTGGIPTL